MHTQKPFSAQRRRVLAIGLIVLAISAGTVGTRSPANAAPPPKQVDLAVHVDDTADPVGSGDQYAYEVRVDNLGDARTDAEVTISLSPGLELIETTGSCASGTPTVCTIRRLEPGAASTIRADVRAVQGGEHSATGDVRAEGDSEAANNHDEERTRCAGCGDGVCDGGDGGESCESCSQDCGACRYCGDGTCGGNETQRSCPDDCGSPSLGGCGDGVCVPFLETWWTCPDDCGGGEWSGAVH